MKQFGKRIDEKNDDAPTEAGAFSGFRRKPQNQESP